MAVTTNHYELIVLGSDIAGLVAAALVARRGKRVLVIPDGSIEGTYRLGSRTLPIENAPIIHMGTPPVQRVFQELGLLQFVKRQHASVDGWVHVVLQNQRLDLEPAERNLAEELRQHWPDDPVEEAWTHQRGWFEISNAVLGQLLTVDNAILADGFWARRFLARVESQLPGKDMDPLRPLPQDHPVRAAARAIEPWLTCLDPAQLGPAASLRLRSLWAAGPEDLPGGATRLRELLLQRIELHAGEIKRDLRVAEILTRRGRVSGIGLLGKPERYGCDHMILATDPRRIFDDVVHQLALPRAVVHSLSSLETVAQRYTLHLEIDASGLSPALAGMVLASPSTPSHEDPSGCVDMTFLRCAVTGEDTRLLSITRLVDPSTPTRSHRDALLEDLDERGILPFCRPYIRWMHSPHDELGATDGFCRPVPELRTSAVAQPMNEMFRFHGDVTLGVGVLPPHSGIRALHFASRLTLPGLGLEGEFATGLAVAGLVATPARSALARASVLSRT